MQEIIEHSFEPEVFHPQYSAAWDNLIKKTELW